MSSPTNTALFSSGESLSSKTGEDEANFSVSLAEKSVVLRAAHLCKQFGVQNVIDDISLELRQGEVVLLRGGNGSGKTTLLNILSGSVLPDTGQIDYCLDKPISFKFCRGWRRWLLGRNFRSETVARAGVARAWQDVRLFPTQNLQNNVAVATPSQEGENPLHVLIRPRAVRRKEADVQHQAQRRLAHVGLSGRELSSADRISLGQSKRGAIARALQGGAKLLLLDEPLAGLDAQGSADIIALLSQLAIEGVTMLIVEHTFNIPSVLKMATSVWTLRNGALSVEGVDVVREDISIRQSNGMAEWFLQLFPQAKVTTRDLTDGLRLSTVSKHSPSSPPVLEVQDLVVFRGHRMVIGRHKSGGGLEGVSFSLSRGELALIEAPNGIGKSTLLSAIAGLIPITQGTIRLNGQNVSRMSGSGRIRRGLRLLQASSRSFPDLTVEEVFRLSRVSHPPQQLGHLLKRRVNMLSGGERQLVSFSSIYAGTNWSVGMLDEPFLALDNDAVRHLQEMLVSSLAHACLVVAIPSPNRQIEST